LLADIQKSPYKDRIIVVLDSMHSASLPWELVQMGIEERNVVIWPKNGIEYYYPPAIIDEIFGSGPELQIQGDSVSRHGVTYTKSNLVAKVVERVTEATAMDAEFQTRLLDILSERIGANSAPA
jgi:hypothetical protein